MPGNHHLGRTFLFRPMWFRAMPALTKGFFEQLLRPGFSYRMVGFGRNAHSSHSVNLVGI